MLLFRFSFDFPNPVAHPHFPFHINFFDSLPNFWLIFKDAGHIFNRPFPLTPQVWSRPSFPRSINQGWTLADWRAFACLFSLSTLQHSSLEVVKRGYVGNHEYDLYMYIPKGASTYLHHDGPIHKILFERDEATSTGYFVRLSVVNLSTHLIFLIILIGK